MKPVRSEECGMSAQKRLFATVLVLGLALSSGVAWAVPRLVRVYIDEEEKAKELALMDLDVASYVSGSHIDVVVDVGEHDRILLKGFRTETLIEDVVSHMDAILDDGMGAYHTYSESTEELHAIAALHPDIAKVDSIGRTYENRAIWAIKISDKPHFNDPSEADVMFVGLHHAREIITPEVCHYLLDHLIAGYGVDPRITRYVNEREIWIIPVLNPDGHVYVEQGHYLWRKNRKPSVFSPCIGVDPNRNYGFGWGLDNTGSSGNPCDLTYRGTGPFSEYETQAIRDLVMSGLHEFTIALSYHSYGRLILYPWGYTSEPTPDAATFAALAESMAAFNGYRPGPSYSNIYPTNGDFDDWMYGDMVVNVGIDGKDPGPPVHKERILAFTFEVGSGFTPSDTQIPVLVEQNLAPNLVAIEYADNPYRVWPPVAPVMEAPVSISGGGWELRWLTPDEDQNNLAVAFEVERATAPLSALDLMESGMKFWEGDGFEVSKDRCHSGSHSLRAGHKADTRASITPVYALEPAHGDSLTLWCWYELPPGHMFFVEVSEDGGDTFSMLSGYMTDPGGEPTYTSGFLTGASAGWTRGAFPLSRYAGVEIVLRLRCVTSAGAPGEGIYLDDVGPVITFNERDIVSSDVTAGRYIPVTSEDSPLLFRVRAVDEDGHRSAWTSAVRIPASQAPPDRIFVTPNPFAAVTTIGFSAADGLTNAGMVPVKLQIFDAAGRLVRTLLQAEVSADRFHEKAWDRTSDDGDRVPSGLYFAVLTVRNRMYAEKVVLISSP